jgi:hypothetical protein
MGLFGGTKDKRLKEVKNLSDAAFKKADDALNIARKDFERSIAFDNKNGGYAKPGTHWRYAEFRKRALEELRSDLVTVSQQLNKMISDEAGTTAEGTEAEQEILRRMREEDKK